MHQLSSSSHRRIVAVVVALSLAPAEALAAEVLRPTEMVFDGGDHVNPYTDVTMHRDFDGPDGVPGFVEPDLHHPHTFRRSRGGPVLLLGDTNWRGMSPVDGALPQSTQ